MHEIIKFVLQSCSKNNKNKRKYLSYYRLLIVDIIYITDEKPHIHINYMISTCTKKELHLEENYTITEGDNNDEIVKKLNEITRSVDVKDILKYKYIDKIQEKWDRFSTQFSLF